MNRARKLLVPSILACVLLAALALAATASAEVLVGEATAPVNPAVEPEADVIGAKAEYDSDKGAVTFQVTTAALPSPGTEKEPNELEMAAALASPSNCSSAGFGGGGSVYPAFIFDYQYLQPDFVTWSVLESATAEPKFENGTGGLAARTTSVTTTTLEGRASKAANLPFNCAVAEVHIGNAIQGQPLIFPIAVPPPPPVTPPTPAPTQTPAAPTPPHAAPAALSIVTPKPPKLKAGKWKTVRIKVANTGGTATASGSLRLKAPRGVLVKPERQRLPVLNAGGAWTVTAKVQLTAKAKKKSTVTLTATAGSAGAKGALVLKRQS
jgi:hypothetical protein